MFLEMTTLDVTYRGWRILLFEVQGDGKIRTECVSPEGQRVANTIVLFRDRDEAIRYTQRYIDRRMDTQ
jgi:hypothetical protein